MTTETKAKISVHALAECLRAARLAAEAISDFEDGGTCNMDSPAFRLHGVRIATIRAAAELANVRVDDFKWFGGKRWYWVTGFLQGQGNCRARMSHAATQALKDAAAIHCPAMQVCEYCQMD